MRLETKIFGEQFKGRDVVLIHGTGARAEMWRHQIPLLLEAKFRCIVPDLRGHGESVEPGERADIDAHLTDIADTLEPLDMALPAVFVGHSLGAIISLELAQRSPEMTSKVLAVAMPGKVPALTTEAFKWFLGWPYHGLRQSGVHHYLGWRPKVLIETDKRALEQVMLNFADLDYCTNIPDVRCPVHFVVGRFDPVAPYLSVKTMHESMPSSTLEVIEWAGHNCMDSQPASFNRWFLEKLAET